jgi:Pyruvate/2-oxoacid:ferredoxin oxidoreductase delta subunit/flavodoxin
MSKRIGLLYFSPTAATKMICRAVALGMGAKDPKVMDMTRPGSREEMTSRPEPFMADVDHVIVGAPVYFGKLPDPVRECLGSIKGKGKGSTALVVYGNRDYGTALRQLAGILMQNGFNVHAAGAFIGRHSYSDIVPVAMGRPDKSDMEKACALGMNSAGVSRSLALEGIPFQADYFSKSDRDRPLKPAFISKRCIQCGICADRCPMGILAPDTGTYRSRAAKALCIGCMACVSHCPQKARAARANVPMKLAMKYILRKAAKERKEPLVVLP